MNLNRSAFHLGGIAITLTGLFWFGSAPAELPRPVAVPAELPNLKPRRALIVEQAESLDRRIREHDAKCSHVPKGSTQAAACAKEMHELEVEIGSYIDSVKAFNLSANIQGSRSAYNYTKVIDQFHVEKNPRYAVEIKVDKNGRKYRETKCNIFAQDVTKAMGSPLPVNTLANDTIDWLKKKEGGGSHGWRKIFANEAQEAANNGRPTVAVWFNDNGVHGHIAIVRPGSAGDTRGVAEAQSGSLVLNATHLKKGFNDQEGEKVIEYWSHD